MGRYSCFVFTSVFTTCGRKEKRMGDCCKTTTEKAGKGKKLLKRAVSLSLSIILILAAIPAASFGVLADEEPQADGIMREAEGGIVLTFSEDGITETSAGNGYAISGTNLEISKSGVYTVTGTCGNGSITIGKSLSDVVLILNNLSLAASGTAPVVIKKSTAAIIHLEGISTLTDNENPEDETSEDTAVAEAFEGAAVKVKSGSSVTFCGTGKLTVNGNAKNGIKGGAESNLIFNDGTYIVTAANNGIAADGSITVNGGSFTVVSENDGMKSVPDETDTVSAGSMSINGGIFDITADGDGIQAESELAISGGDFTIKTFGGYNSSGFDEDTMSAKGLKASGDRADIENIISVSGGTFNLNTRDDAIHSDTDATITGGTFSIYTGDDGVHADSVLTLGAEGARERDPEILVLSSYEGLEGGNVYINQGKYFVKASDDGINAAGGSANGSDPGQGGDPFHPGGHGQGGSGSTGDYSLNILGGTVYVDCNGDGLDSNGPLTITGGNIAVFSMKKGGDNSPLDADGTLTVKGAEIFCAGSNPMNENPSSASHYCFTDKTSRSAGTVVTLKSGNTVLYSTALLRTSNYILYSNPSISSGISLIAGGSVDKCRSDGFAHDWDGGEVVTAASGETDGVMVYTCSSCGKKEYKTVKAVISYACGGHEASGSEESDEGYEVTFSVGEGAAINVYYTQDYSSPDETGVTKAVSRNSDTGKPDSTGDGQLNFAVVLKNGYRLSGVTIDGSYKNLKDVSTENLPNTYRVTKIASALTVTVDTEYDGAENVPVTGISLDRDTITIPAESSEALKVTVTPENATDPSVDFTSSNPKTAIVDENGTVTGVSYGTATITAKTADGGFTAKCTVNVLFRDVTDPTKAAYTAIYELAKEGIVKGYGSYFDINNTCTRAQFILFLWRLAGSPAPSSENLKFSDASEIRKLAPDYAKAIAWGSENGIVAGFTSGVNKGKFKPNDPCTRAQVVMFLWRYKGKPTVSQTSVSFKDEGEIKALAPDYTKAIAWAAAKKITTGYSDNTFRPNKSCTRGECVTFLYRMRKA